MRRVTFDSEAFDQFTDWATQDKRVYDRIINLINDTMRSPFKGIGKPEPLKHNLRGCWSRRITSKHRLIYKVNDAEIIILSCNSHYDD